MVIDVYLLDDAILRSHFDRVEYVQDPAVI